MIKFVYYKLSEETNYSLKTTVTFSGTVTLSHASSDAVDICIHRLTTTRGMTVDNVDYRWTFNGDFGSATVRDNTEDQFNCIACESDKNGNMKKIRLVNDITLSKKWEFSGTTTTIDLAGRKITNASEFAEGKDPKNVMISIMRNSTITIKDTLGGGSVEVVENGSIVDSCFFLSSGTSKTYSPELIIEAGYFKAPTYVIVGNGDEDNDWPGENKEIFNRTKVNIEGGTFETSDGPVIYQPQYGLLKISGGTLTGSDSAVEVRAGSVTITGGEFISTANEYECRSNTSGTTTKGAALAIAQHTTDLPIAVKISGGKFSGVRALSVENPENNASKESWRAVTVEVTGGTFKSTSSGTTAIKVGEVFALTTTGDKATAYSMSSEFTVESDNSFTVSKNVTQ